MPGLVPAALGEPLLPMDDPLSNRTGLPAEARLETLSHRWGVSLHRTVETPGSLLGFGAREGRGVVLKVVRTPHEEWDAGAVVAAFAGHGMVRALEHLPGAVLLEEVRPGTPLVDLVRQRRDDEATDVLVGVIQEMAAAEPDTRGLPTAEDWAPAFGEYLAGRAEAVQPEAVGTELVGAARDMYMELCGSQHRVRLLHGDLQHYNVLLDRDRGWLAIDPKGIVAELEFELGVALRNPAGAEDLLTPPAMARRVDRFAWGLDVQAGRVVGWAFAQAVLSAIWLLEDGQDVRPDTPALLAARAARALIDAERTG